MGLGPGVMAPVPAHTGLQPVPCTRVTHMLAAHQQALLPLGTEPRVTSSRADASPASRWVRAREGVPWPVSAQTWA